MGLGLIYWILMLFFLIFGVWLRWQGTAAPPGPYPWAPLAPFGFIFVLLLILGWQVFGAPIRG